MNRNVSAVILIATSLLVGCPDIVVARQEVRQTVMVSNPEKSPQGVTARAFAVALVSGDYSVAVQMLSPLLQRSYSADRLKAEFQSMISYGKGAPRVDGVMTAMDDWPDKRPGDVGWAYVAVGGDDYGEAVSVVVSSEGGRNVIREIEWGRP